MAKALQESGACHHCRQAGLVPGTSGRPPTRPLPHGSWNPSIDTDAPPATVPTSPLWSPSPHPPRSNPSSRTSSCASSPRPRLGLRDLDPFADVEGFDEVLLSEVDDLFPSSFPGSLAALSLTSPLALSPLESPRVPATPGVSPRAGWSHPPPPPPLGVSAWRPRARAPEDGTADYFGGGHLAHAERAHHHPSERRLHTTPVSSPAGSRAGSPARLRRPPRVPPQLEVVLSPRRLAQHGERRLRPEE